MRKKHILLVFLACLIFCLNFTACDDSYKKEPVYGVWDQLKSTAWTMERTVDGYTIKYTIGFYGGQNGPESKYYSTSGDPRRKPYPYAFIRAVTENAPGEWPNGRYFITRFYDIKISRTGDKITETDPALEYDYDLIRTYYESHPEEFYTYRNPDGTYQGQPRFQTWDEVKRELDEERAWAKERPWGSFGISLSGNTLTVSGSKNIEFDTSGIDRNGDLNNVYNRITQINGTYTKLNSDPKFAFDEGWQLKWPNLKNTAWTKQGSSSPTVGFYEYGKGPGDGRSGNMVVLNDSSGYFFLIAPNGGSFANRLNRNRDGVYFNIDDDRGGSDWSTLNFIVNVSGNTLTISNISLRQRWVEVNGEWQQQEVPITINNIEYTKAQVEAFFGGTYTIHSGDPNYAFDDDRQALWTTIKNTAWKKDGEDPSVGFYEKGQGPSPYSFSWDDEVDGYFYTKKDGSYRDNFRLTISPKTRTLSGGYTELIQPSIDRLGKTISYNTTLIDIAVSGSTLTISNVRRDDRYTGSTSDLTYYRGFEGTYTLEPGYTWP